MAPNGTLDGNPDEGYGRMDRILKTCSRWSPTPSVPFSLRYAIVLLV